MPAVSDLCVSVKRKTARGNKADLTASKTCRMIETIYPDEDREEGIGMEQEKTGLAVQEETSPVLPAQGAPEDGEPKSEEEKKKDIKKKAIKAGVAVVTSASVLVGGLFSSPDALLAPEQNLNPVSISQNDNDQDGDEEDEESEEEEEEIESAAIGLLAKLRLKLLQLPLAVRVFVLVPLWAIGFTLWTVAGGLWTTLLGPIAGKAVSWLFLLAALLGAVALGMKAVFPDLPLRKIVNKKSILGLVLGGLALGVADLTLPMFWDGYVALAHVLKATGMAAILGSVSFALIKRTLKKKKAEAVPAEGPAEEPTPDWTDAKILALADSVSRPRK